MLSDICIGKYIPNDSVVYKLNPLFKLLSVIIMIISIFFITFVVPHGGSCHVFSL